MKLSIWVLLFAMIVPSVHAKGNYMSQTGFITATFGVTPPAPKVIWLKGDLKKEIKAILGAPYPKIRLKYWQTADTTAWILDVVGKEKPITAGFVVKGDQIISTTVLAFRESRGWEVKREAFTRQFNGIKLTPSLKLTHHIDGITGATLSVNAMTQMARIALKLNQEVSRNRGPR